MAVGAGESSSETSRLGAALYLTDLRESRTARRGSSHSSGPSAVRLREAAAVRLLESVSQKVRDEAKAKGWSLSDGSYPIMNVSMLKAAATLAASKHGNWKAALALIRRRAKDLGVKLSSLPGFAAEGS